MIETDVLIIGGGLAGLSAGYHLNGIDHIIVEAEEQVGGLCKSYHVDGFDFDCTGHLIHFRSPEGRRIVTELLGDKIAQHQRKAAIFIAGRYTDYPFQANTFGLPPEMIRDCLLGFIDTLLQKRKPRINNFRDWIDCTFGEGIAKHFMIPYNEKLWQHDLSDIALDWVNWSIPKPNIQDVINGALGIKNKEFGYNPVFYYPREGGINLLPNSFPVKGQLMLGSPAAKIHLKKRQVTLQDGTTVGYRQLFSTMPLHALLQIIEDAPRSLCSLRDKLRYVSVLNLNLGIDREQVIPYHWVYFPERDKPFYRVGCLSNFSESAAPAGTSSLFVEVSLRPDRQYDVAEVIQQAITGLKTAGILRAEDKIVSMMPVILQYAYVVYDSARKSAVASIRRHLNSRGVFSFGRYGSWNYSSMEDAILQGKEFAETSLTARV